MGYEALNDNTTASSGTAVGFLALSKVTEGNYNTAFGAQAGEALTTGSSNTALGYAALLRKTTGSQNVAVGPWSMQNGTTGDYNVAVGRYALKNATGNFNVGIGSTAGQDITSGAKNVVVGGDSDVSAAAAQNQIVIGSDVTGLGDNYAVIGNASVTRLYAAQDGAAVLYANGTIQSSDRRVKKSVNSLAYGLNFIMKLRPVSYYKLHPRNYPQELKDKFYPNGKIRDVDAEDYNKLQVGFIAQEVKEVNDQMNAENNIVNVDDDGFHRMDYEKIVVPLVKAVQEQQAQIVALQQQIDALKSMQANNTQSDSYEESSQ